MKSLSSIGAYVCALTLLSAPAFADVISPDEAACQAKTAGDSCTQTNPPLTGVCVKSTCHKLDYAH